MSYRLEIVFLQIDSAWTNSSTYVKTMFSDIGTVSFKNLVCSKRNNRRALIQRRKFDKFRQDFKPVVLGHHFYLSKIIRCAIIYERSTGKPCFFLKATRSGRSVT